MKIIIAGNYRQYENYLNEKGLSLEEARNGQILYVSSTKQLLGLHHNCEIVKYGEWWLNPCANFKELKEE